MPNSVLIDRDKCTGCRVCAEVCPVNVFDIIDKKSVARRVSKCMGCQLCEVECPVAAITVERVASKVTSPWGTKAAAEPPAKEQPKEQPVAASTLAQASKAPFKAAFPWVTRPTVETRTEEQPREQPVVASATAPASTHPPQSWSTSSTVGPKREMREAASPWPPSRTIQKKEEGFTQQDPAGTPVSAPISVPSRSRVAAPQSPSPPIQQKVEEVLPSSSSILSWEYPSSKKTPETVEVSRVTAPSATLKTVEDSSEAGRKILTVFPELCVNCRICELVCSLKHTGEFNPYKACLKITYNGNSGPYTPTICRHCHKAACEAACPTQALYYQGRIVLLDRSKCINCLECVRACPFSAIQVGPSGEIYKCDLCGGDPMCAKYCPPRPENTAGRINHAKASAIQYVESHNVNAMRRIGLAASKK